MKRIIVVMVTVSLALVGLGLGLFLSNAQAQVGCEHYVIDGPIQGEVMQAVPSGAACVILEPTFPGNLQVTGGWVFTSPLTLNETEILETKRVTGEEAPQIVPFSQPLFAHEELKFEASPTANGSSELGLFFSYTEPELACEEVKITDNVTGTLVTNLLTGTVTGACIDVRSRVTGTLEVSSGWAFTSPVTLNGETIETKQVEGELASQVIPFTRTVDADEVLIFLASPMRDKSSELGLGISFRKEPEPKVFRIYMPLVCKDPPTLVEERSFSGGLEVLSASWNGVVDEQRTCLKVNFGRQETTTLLRGWVSERAIEATLNGETLELQTYDKAGEQLPQIRETSLDEPSVLEICLNEGTSREIGLVLSQ